MSDGTDRDPKATRAMLTSEQHPTSDYREQSRAPGSGRLEVRCPNCHVPTNVAADTSLTDLTCGSCGSRFSLVDQSKATCIAPSLSKLGRFELIERLGVGSFGTVWKARDKELDRAVAIKIPRASGMSAEEQEKFFREARAAAQLKHPSIVSVHEVGRDGDSFYIVSDFVRGVTLDDWLTGQKLTAREAAELCAKIADALHHAHEHGVVHRDLKPANIMMDYDGQPHVMDFGLARRESGEVTMTLEGQVLGTPAYMSPEQAQGEAHKADRRSDVYSLGVVLFQLLTGELPFRGNARMLIKQVIHDEPPSPRKLNSYVSKDLETITLKCLEKIPNRRYASANEVSAELRCYLAGESIKARPIGRLERAARWVHRNKAIATLSAMVFLALLVGSVASATFAVNARQQAAVALLRERDAEAVTEFLVQSFETVNPINAGGVTTAAELLKHAEEQLTQDLVDQPLVRAKLLDTIGRAQMGLGAWDGAIQSLSMARSLRQQSLGTEHSDTISTMNYLADAYYGARRFDEAISLRRQVIETRRARLGINHRDTLTSEHDLAVDLSSAGQRAKAIQMHEDVLERRRATLGNEDPDTLRSIYNLANSYFYHGQRDKAIPLYEVALVGRRKTLGNNHPHTLMSMYGLAEAYFRSGRVKESIPLYEECSAGRRSTLGLRHPDTLSTMKALADAYTNDGRFRKAIELHEQTLALRQEVLGASHRYTFFSMLGLIQAYKHADRLKEAADQYEQAVAVWPKNIELADAANGIAWRLATSPVEERRDGKRAVELATKACELTEYKYAYLVDTLAAAYAEAGDFNKAVEWEEKALQLLGPNETNTRFYKEYKQVIEDYKAKKPRRNLREPTVTHNQDQASAPQPSSAEPSAGENEKQDAGSQK